MKLEKLRLKGFIGIRDGLGLEEITIDFSNIVGLVAIAGANGTGKSTFLKSCHPYNIMSPGEPVLYTQVYTRDAEKDLSFSYNGDQYRTLLKIDAQSERSEGYIWKNGIPEVNGKISQYAKYIEALFGSPALFFASIFAAQNAEKMSDMRTGELKELFAEFLRLDREEAWAGGAKQAGNFYQGHLSSVDGRITALQIYTAGKVQANLDRCAAGDKAGSLQDEKTVLIHTLEEKRVDIDILKTTIQQNALAIQRKAEQQGQIDRLEGELAKEKKAAETEIAALGEKWKEIKGQIGKADAVLQDREKIETAAGEVKALEDTAAELQGKMEALNADLPGHQQKVHDLETALTGLRQQVKDLENDAELIRIGKAIEATDKLIEGKKRDRKAFDNDPELVRLLSGLKNLEAAAKVGEGIDADCKSMTCAAIKSVNEAVEKLPAAKEAALKRAGEVSELIEFLTAELSIMQETAVALLEEKKDRVKVISDLKSSLEDQLRKTINGRLGAMEVLSGANELLATYRQDLAAKRAEIVRQKRFADRLPEVKVAETRKADLEKQLQEVTAAGTEKKEAWQARESATKAMMQTYRDSLDAISIDWQAEESLKVTQAEITEIETVRIPAVETEIQAARDRIATLQAELSRIEAAETELEEFRGQRDLFTRNMSEWRLIQAACGKNGIQALEISGAAPAITGYANDLMAKAFGPLFSLNLITQDDEGRECLKIKVINEEGVEADLARKSGGQQVWNLMALRLGMTLLSKEKSERRFETAFADEFDGALDDMGSAESFVGMYRAFMAVANLHALLFISHKRSCWNLADHVLTFEHGKNPAWG